MANINFDRLTEDGKVIFFLGLSEKVLSVFSQKEEKIFAQEVIYKCWEWVEDKENIGDILYDLLDNEENGITIIQEMSVNEVDVIAWNCIIDAVAYTSRKAFEKEGVKYYPEPIALVDDTLVNHCIECFEKCIENSDGYIQRISSLLYGYQDEEIASDLRKKILTINSLCNTKKKVR
ncbi:Imm6 family immunity protein [Bacillus cereus group sp. RP37]|uniref:Imm6 family immunity protein n=1 Tax=Bacillus TaxID=1386 RepID=UPI000BF61DB0|nr:hypothetical protein [Bacillus wiedmannii]MDA1602985.1 Imm6 family immunity protein [Bacillus cereus]RFB15611.1 hypothetical protein DZB88_00880 [Bacillus sp. OE]RFB68476.1 hypothetical protein DZB94_27735 [Bacillus sp. AW]PFF83053.1 hypothetical protein CN338_29145 [Bacillus cereus]